MRSPDVATRDDFRERRWALGIALLAMAVTMLPYLFGSMLQGAAPARGFFTWLGYNLDDSCVYLAWMRQAADGGFFQRNLFTTDPQVGHQFSVFFLLLGWCSRLTHLPLLFVYHAARIVLGVAFLRSVWWLIGMLIACPLRRRAAYLTVCFSAGLGWLPGLWRHSGIDSPVDVWQPESVTFLCVYLSPLFLVSLLLMVGVLGNLWLADRDHSMKRAMYAGLCGLLLGNIHTYDVITLMAIWGAYLIARSVAARRFDGAAWIHASIAGLMSAVSSGYMLYLVRTEGVFARRVAVPTLSPGISLYLLGYGLLLPLAATGAWALWRGKSDSSDISGASDESGRSDRRAALFLCIWFVANVAVAYAPVSFQRKMLMGAHLPIAILAGIAVSAALRRLPARVRTVALCAAIVGLGLTNVRFMLRDADNFQTNRGQSGIHRPYLYAGEVSALAWIREHAPAAAPIQPLPWIARTADGRAGFVDTTVACITPGLTGHPVDAGHWGETPDFRDAMGSWMRFVLPTTSPEERAALLRSSGVRYLIFSQKHEEARLAAGDMPLTAWTATPGLRLLPEASNDDADVYVATAVD